MHFLTLTARSALLLLAAGFFVAPAIAQAPPAEKAPPAGTAPPAEEATEETDAAVTPDAAETDIMKDVDVDKLDWSQLNVDASTLNLAPAKGRAKGTADGGAAWSSSLKATAPHRSRSSNRCFRSGMRGSAPT